MSDEHQHEHKKLEQLEEKLHELAANVRAHRPIWLKLLRGLGWVAMFVVLLVMVGLLALDWYSKTADFQRRVRGEVVKVLEDSTGGRVEVGQIKFDLWHLAIESDGLVIHGLEGPGEAPYFAADRIFVRVQIYTFARRVAGVSHAEDPGSHIGLNLLRVERPQAHFIFEKDGKTNQPEPNLKESNEPVMDKVLDLEAKEVELVDGVAMVNDKAIPMNVAARNVQTTVRYLATRDRYGLVMDLNDLRTQIDNEPEAKSTLHLEVEAGRDIAELTKFELKTGASSTVSATAWIQHYAQAEWQVNAKGSLELKQLGALAGVDGFSSGVMDLNVQGHSCVVPPTVAQKQPHFWQREQAKTEHERGAFKTLAPDPGCKLGYLLTGNVKARGMGYSNEDVHLTDVVAGADLHVTPTELLFTALSGTLPGGGGGVEGQLRIENWLGEVPVSAPARSATTVAAATMSNTLAKGIGAKAPIKSLKIPQTAEPAHAYMQVTLKSIPLWTVMYIVGPPGYGDLAFDTAVSGPAKVEWGGPAKDLESSVEVDGDLKFAPTGVKRANVLNVPVTASVLAHYTGKTEVVNIQKLHAESPASTMDITGALGVNKGDPLTNLRADLALHDLGEFDSLLTTLGYEANGKKGTAGIPVALHGAANFHVTTSGAVRNLEVKGHVDGNNVEAKLGLAADIQFDSAVGDVDYSPSNVAIANSTIKRGTAVLNVSGTFAPRTVVGRQGVVDYEWDEGVTMNAQVKLANAKIEDVLQIFGQQKRLPVTGTVNLDGHAQGTIKNLQGTARVSLANGAAYGEPYQTAVLNGTIARQDLEFSSATVMLHGITVSGSGGYDFDSKHLHGHLAGNNLVLSKFAAAQRQELQWDGTLSFIADADGTVDAPNLKATARLAAVKFDGQDMGDATVEAHSSGRTLSYTASSTMLRAKMGADGQTELQGDYTTHAKLTMSGVDLGQPLSMFGTTSVKASSSMSGTVTVDGPLRRPTAMSGLAEINAFDVKLQGVELKAAEPLRVSLKDGVATLEQVHITGEDTDLRANGTVQVFGANSPQGGQMNLRANGNVSMALTRTFDPDLISSGRVSFTMRAEGRVKKPALTGRVTFQNVNLAMDGVPNGLSDMNGTLMFNQDRLNVEQLTAMTGGGQLKIGGFLTYQDGIYANLTATGDVVRVRLYGLSATANANFTLQGGPQSALLSGTVLITRFGVGQNVDFASFANTGGVSTPLDPDAATNKVRLDVHVTSSPQLDFQNSYAKLAGTVDLTVRGTVAAPSVLGRIQITDGSATFAGTKYQVQRGDIYFTNPVRIDPTIDLDVTARVENYDVTVGLHGTMATLKPTYRSEPPLSEADVFNLLALGRTQEEAQLYQEQQVQAGTDPTTSALLGGALNATVSSRVNKLFGAGSVKIDPAFVGTLGNSAARITVQEPLSRDVTLTFATNVNQSAQQLIQMQYQITDSMAIVVSRDESGVFSVVYKIRKRYR